MTKYEWESELRKNIHRLPNEEIKRVLEYYGELFDDKAERGLGETEIIAQFGNPVDVADKILSEYEGELKPADNIEVPDLSVKQEQEYTEEKEEQSKSAQSAAVKKSYNSGFKIDRLILFIVLNCVTGFLPLIIVGAVWIVAAALTLSGGAMAIGGVAGTLISVIGLCMGNGVAGLAQLGSCVALCGVGILLACICVFMIRLMAKGTTKLFKIVRDWVCPRESNANEQSGVEA